MISRTSISNGAGSPSVTGFYEADTGSIQYVVADEDTGKVALIDVVKGFDPASASTNEDAAEEILGFVARKGYEVEWILDTHPHADHLMASASLRDRLGAPNAIGAHVEDVAKLWREIYNEPDAFAPERDFNRLFRDGDEFRIGNLPARVIHSPGHTLASITYVVGDAAFVHDTLMQPDFGTARADFPGGSAHELYRTIQTILALPEETRLFIGHDYGTEARKEPAWEATVAEHREKNVHVGGGVGEEEYVKLREKRDAGLGLPDRMLFALQFNLRGGRLPPADSNGSSYFRIPANHF
ncbi:MBL fold metallo-hydrolase [Pikeienuella piscinae]|uniref:MBL fold metallo-hydrolase n=1 Tax=Pikeienuella piscinae TaxID=2748098 RepID=A0A7L5BW61_9RHOB|nr:MBL fold metallo-hydrolase [Pikeienuella piscinae]QIE55373.1 MBL fold metallo-hydrolase [Pikeienuella piscinae]